MMIKTALEWYTVYEKKPEKDKQLFIKTTDGNKNRDINVGYYDYDTWEVIVEDHDDIGYHTFYYEIDTERDLWAYLPKLEEE